MSPDDVNALARNNKIKGYKIGKQWCFRSKDVMRFIDTMQVEWRLE